MNGSLSNGRKNTVCNAQVEIGSLVGASKGVAFRLEAIPNARRAWPNSSTKAASHRTDTAADWSATVFAQTKLEQELESRGTWQALLLHSVGTIERLSRVPNTKAKRRVVWTDCGADVIDEGRANV